MFSSRLLEMVPVAIVGRRPEERGAEEIERRGQWRRRERGGAANEGRGGDGMPMGRAVAEVWRRRRDAAARRGVHTEARGQGDAKRERAGSVAKKATWKTC